MRFAAVMVGLVLLATPAMAQVKLVVKRDGTKVISNFGVAGGGKGTNWDWLAKQHDRRTKYDEIIERHAARYGVDPVLVRAVIQVESNFNANCVSNKGARGLMQLMPATAKRYGVKDINDPEENIRGGVKFLADLQKLFRDDLRRMLAGYNAGENAVLRYGGIPPYEETQTYVARALTVYYGRPQGGGGTFFAGGRGVKKLRGGFGAAAAQPIAAAAAKPLAMAMVPGMKVLGTQ
ncbi:MAG TPA: lytic transglycosylase domain-containing protein [Thermoanaerobaculia bacterium]